MFCQVIIGGSDDYLNSETASTASNRESLGDSDGDQGSNADIGQDGDSVLEIGVEEYVPNEPQSELRDEPENELENKLENELENKSENDSGAEDNSPLTVAKDVSENDSGADSDSDSAVSIKSVSDSESKEGGAGTDIGADSDYTYFYLIESDSKIYVIKKDNSLYVYNPSHKVESIGAEHKYDLGAELDSDLAASVQIKNLAPSLTPEGKRAPIAASQALRVIGDSQPVRDSLAFLLTTYRAVKLLKVMCDIGNVEVSDYITYQTTNSGDSNNLQKAACVVTHQDSRDLSATNAPNSVKRARATLMKYLDILRHLHTRAILMTYNYRPIHVFNNFRANTGSNAGVGGINIMNAAYVAEYDARNIVWDIIESSRAFQEAASELVPNYGGDVDGDTEGGGIGSLGDIEGGGIGSKKSASPDSYRQGDFLQIIKICSLIDIRNAIKYSGATLSTKETAELEKILAPSNMTPGASGKYSCATLFPIEKVLELLK